MNRNEGTAAKPDYASRSGNPFDTAAVGYQASPAFADLDDDGDLDVFFGQSGFLQSFNGTIVYFENTGGMPPEP